LRGFDHKPNVDSRKLLQKRIDKANPCRNLTAEEAKRLNKLEAIADKLRRGENVQSSVEVAHYLHTNYW
jgi:2-iminoacetate synthase ThiH